MVDPGDRPVRNVLVVGAARGIGLATAERFAAVGHRVTATWHHVEPGDVPAVEWVRCDMTDPGDVQALFDRSGPSQHPFEVVVANAALVRDRLSSRMTDDDFTAVVDVNLVGTFRVVRAALAAMTEARWGRVVVLSSIGAVYGNVGQANYAASKAGVEAMIRSLAREVGPRNVTVNAVSPGGVATELIAAMSPRLQRRWLAMMPAGRMAEPDEVAAAVTFLASERSRAITGTVLTVDGGAVA